MAKVKKKRPRSSSRRNRSEETELTLPDRPNKPPSRLEDSVTCIYGRKGIGKTTLASRFKRDKKTFVLMAEKGRNNLSIYQRLPKNFEEAVGYRDLFLGSDKYDLIVVDTIDRIHEMVTKWILEERNLTSVLKCPLNERPALYQEINSTFGGFFGEIIDAGKGLVVISHETVREMENRKIAGLKGLMHSVGESDDDDEDSAEDSTETGKLERIQPSCSPAAFREIEQVCNYVLYYGYMGRERCITVRGPGDYAWVSAGGEDNFLDPDGNPLFSFSVGSSPEQAYDDLLAAYNNERRDINYRPPRRTAKKKKKTRR